MFDVTFFRDRNVEEKKEETKRLEEVTITIEIKITNKDKRRNKYKN